MFDDCAQAQQSDMIEAFHIVVEHLAYQGIQCRSRRNNSCQYRGTDKDGKCLSCAVGVLITDEEYKPVWEECGGVRQLYARGVWEEISWLRRLNFTTGRHMLISLQHIHDKYLVDDWKVLLQGLAEGILRSYETGLHASVISNWAKGLQRREKENKT